MATLISTKTSNINKYKDKLINKHNNKHIHKCKNQVHHEVHSSTVTLQHSPNITARPHAAAARCCYCPHIPTPNPPSLPQPYTRPPCSCNTAATPRCSPGRPLCSCTQPLCSCMHCHAALQPSHYPHTAGVTLP